MKELRLVFKDYLQQNQVAETKVHKHAVRE